MAEADFLDEFEAEEQYENEQVRLLGGAGKPVLKLIHNGALSANPLCTGKALLESTLGEGS